MKPLSITAEQFSVIEKAARHFDLQYSLGSQPGEASVLRLEGGGATRRLFAGAEMVAMRRLVAEMAGKLAMWLSEDGSKTIEERVYVLVRTPEALSKVRRGHRALERRAKRRAVAAENSGEGLDFRSLHNALNSMPIR